VIDDSPPGSGKPAAEAGICGRLVSKLIGELVGVLRRLGGVLFRLGYSLGEDRALFICPCAT